MTIFNGNLCVDEVERNDRWVVDVVWWVGGRCFSWVWNALLHAMLNIMFLFRYLAKFIVSR